MTNSAIKTQDRFITVDGLNIRYLEEGSGISAMLTHGISLGSAADVFQRNMPVLAAAGIRAIAFDYPGFGKSDLPQDMSGKYREDFLFHFADALGIEKFAVVAHSQSANLVVSIALEHPERITHLFLSDAAGLLPPLETGNSTVGGGEEAAIARLQDRMTRAEPSLEDIRTQMETFLYNHDLITDEELKLRYESCTGKAHANFVARRQAAQAGTGGMEAHAQVPLWQRLDELKMPVSIIFGKQDRARTEERAKLLQERYPHLPIHIVDGSKHMAHWDKEAEYNQMAIDFLKK